MQTHDVYNLQILPIKLGGLRIKDPVRQAQGAHPTSRVCITEAVSAMKNKTSPSFYSHLKQVQKVRSGDLQEIESTLNL